MEQCLECTETQDVPSCTENLIIGKVEIGQECIIYLKNNATGYIHKQFADADPDGLITLDMTLPYNDFYSPNFYFTMWVTDIEGGMFEYQQVEINENNYTCFSTRFVVIKSDDLIVSLETYTLAV